MILFSKEKMDNMQKEFDQALAKGYKELDVITQEMLNAVNDPILRKIMEASNLDDDISNFPFHHFALADRAEELGFLLAAAHWRLEGELVKGGK
jgi:hypothetical protein